MTTKSAGTNGGEPQEPDDVSWFPVEDIPKLYEGVATDALWSALGERFEPGLAIIMDRLHKQRNDVLKMLGEAGRREKRKIRIANYWLEPLLIAGFAVVIVLTVIIWTRAGTDQETPKVPAVAGAHTRSFTTSPTAATQGVFRFSVARYSDDEAANGFQTLSDSVTAIPGFDALTVVSSQHFGDRSATYAGVATLHGLNVNVALIVVRQDAAVFVLEALTSSGDPQMALAAIAEKLFAPEGEANSESADLADHLPSIDSLPPGYAMTEDLEQLPSDMRQPATAAKD